ANAAVRGKRQCRAGLRGAEPGRGPAGPRGLAPAAGARHADPPGWGAARLRRVRPHRAGIPRIPAKCRRQGNHHPLRLRGAGGMTLATGEILAAVALTLSLALIVTVLLLV